MPHKIAAALLVLLSLSACSPTVEDTRPGQPVKHRQEAFKDILRHFEPMGVMLRDKQYDADRFLPLAEGLVSRREQPWQYFGPDTDYPPSKSKPALWQDLAGFERERQTFIAATDALLAAARSREPGQVQAAYDRVYDSCKACHRAFKQ